MAFLECPALSGGRFERVVLGGTAGTGSHHPVCAGVTRRCGGCGRTGLAGASGAPVVPVGVGGGRFLSVPVCPLVRDHGSLDLVSARLISELSVVSGNCGVSRSPVLGVDGVGGIGLFVGVSCSQYQPGAGLPCHVASAPVWLVCGGRPACGGGVGVGGNRADGVLGGGAGSDLWEIRRSLWSGYLRAGRHDGARGGDFAQPFAGSSKHFRRTGTASDGDFTECAGPAQRGGSRLYLLCVESGRDCSGCDESQHLRQLGGPVICRSSLFPRGDGRASQRTTGNGVAHGLPGFLCQSSDI